MLRAPPVRPLLRRQRRPQRLRSRTAQPRRGAEELPPYNPTTCGKTERFQRTLKKWLAAQPDQPATRNKLQTVLDAFVDEYHHRRPHRPCRTGPPPPPSTPRGRRPPPRPTETPTPTTGSAATGSTPPAWSPSATTAASTTSALGEPTPEPTSCSSSGISTSGSSTPKPGNCSASSPSTPAATSSPPADPQAHQNGPKTIDPGPKLWVQGHSYVLRDHTVRPAGFEPATFGLEVRRSIR